jgi:hypothetical protein
MECKGKIIAVLPVVTGQGKNGEWRKQEFVIEIPDTTYPKKVCLSLWGDKVPVPAIGQTAMIQFDVESREYNGRWFTECKAWKIDVEQNQQQQPAQSEAFQAPAAQQQGTATDLPF